MHSRWLFRVALLIPLMILAIASVNAQGSTSYCPLPDEAGIWENPDPDMKDVTRIEVEHHCDDRARDVWRLRVKSKCYPRDCSWGYAKGEVIDGSLYALFRGFIGKQLVKLDLDEDKLKVAVFNDYISDAREDHWQHFILVRVE